MAAGKPIIGAINGESARIIEDAKCGYAGEAENAEKLAENIMKFVTLSAEERLILAENGMKYNAENFNKDKFFYIITNLFNLCVDFNYANRTK